MNITSCPKCGARWIDSQLYWSTGQPGTNEDLAGLVCDKYGDQTCINKLKGTDHRGDTWPERLKFLEKLEKKE